MKPELAVLFFIIGTILMMALYGNELLLFGIMSCAAVGCLAIDGWKVWAKVGQIDWAATAQANGLAA